MKVLLIRPKPDKHTIGLQHVMICEPLELEYIASNIEGNISVEIIDMIIEKKPLRFFIEKYDPDVVGMSGYITHVNVIKTYAKEIKGIKPTCKVVVGGVHAEVVPEDFVHEDIDFIIEANGLKTFNSILKDLNNKEIEGIYRRGKKSEKELTFEYRFPDRSKVQRYRKKYYYMFHNPCALIKTSFGCPYHCSFCFCKEITNGKYFTRSVDSVIEELKEIPEEEIYIVDDDFLFSRERITEFCDKLKANRIHKKFLVYGRADFVYHNEDMIQLFAQHGLRAVIVGLESIKNEALDQYNKKTSLMENEGAIRILQKHGVEVYGTLILDIDFTKEDFQRLYQWLKKMNLIFVNLQPFTPLKGTSMYEAYQGQLIIPENQYEKWDLAHMVLQPTNMSVRRYYFEIIRLYYKITMRPQNLGKLLKRYNIKDVLKLSVGSSRVTWQYIQKMIRGI